MQGVIDDDRCSVSLRSDDGVTHVRVRGAVTSVLPEGSVFATLEEASAFFEAGAMGYSDTEVEGRFDGLELRTDAWAVEALEIAQVDSSYFLDAQPFAAGSVQFDRALLMRGIPHDWHGREPLCCG